MYVCTYKHIIHVYCNITSISKVLSFPSLRKSLNKNMDFNVCFTTIIVIIIIMSSTFLFVCLIFIIFPLYLVPCFISSSMGLRGNVLQFRPWTCDTKTRTLHKETAATSQSCDWRWRKQQQEKHHLIFRLSYSGAWTATVLITAQWCCAASCVFAAGRQWYYDWGSQR